MRKTLLLSAALLFACALASSTTARGEDYGYSSSSGYNIERWDEDWSWLKDHWDEFGTWQKDPRSDYFDPLKYILFSESLDSYISIGGQARYRYDLFNNSNFGAGPEDNDGFHLTRLLLHADIHLNENFRAFVQINSGMVDNRVGGPRPGDADEIDFQQAFLDATAPIGDGQSVLFRFGRQELIYGAQRLISPNDWGNVRRTFEGAKAEWVSHNNTLDVFWVRPVLINNVRLNNGDNSQSFEGVYNVTALPDLIRGADSRLELYFLGLNKTRPDDSDTYTLGTRFKTTPGNWDFDFQPDYQFGKTGANSISAWAVATEACYTCNYSTFTPRASVGLDIASGSPNPGHRFNQLFPPLYLYLGHMYVLGRQNVIDLHQGLDFHLTRDVTLSLAEHIFWRQNTSDAAYSLTGSVVRAAGASRAAYTGNEFDIVTNWQINKHISTYVGYAHFFAGDFIQETGKHDDIDFFYASMTFAF